MNPNQKCQTRYDTPPDNSLGFYNNNMRVGGGASNSNQSNGNGNNLWQRVAALLLRIAIALVQYSAGPIGII